MHEIELKSRTEKLKALEGRERVKVLWMWIKQEVIAMSEFQAILNELYKES